MNIVVSMKQIPDLQQIRIRNRQPVLDGIPFVLGAIDKNALEMGVSLKESLGGKLIVLSAGNENIKETIKEALAAGADEACLVIDNRLDGAESSIVAKVLAKAISHMDDVGVILFGEGSGDNYSGQVGSRVAELLGISQASYTSAIEVDGNTLRVTCSLEDCDEIIEMNMPAVITVMADINEPRIPSVSQILKAGKKPKKILQADELGLDFIDEMQVITLGNLAPENKRKRIIVENADELIHILSVEGILKGD